MMMIRWCDDCNNEDDDDVDYSLQGSGAEGANSFGCYCLIENDKRCIFIHFYCSNWNSIWYLIMMLLLMIMMSMVIMSVDEDACDDDSNNNNNDNN